MAPMTNITITVPEGTTNHGDPDILCVPSKWTDILIFYAVNYFAHAVTVKSLPGEKLEETAYYIAMALIYPYSGLLRGIEAITRRAAWCRGNELQQAARAGALCVVVRDKTWKPLDGQIVSGCEICKLPDDLSKGTSTLWNTVKAASALEQVESKPHSMASWFALVPANFYEGFGKNPIIGKDRTVHGNKYLPPGYSLAYLPSNTKIETNFRGNLADVSISSSYSIIKALISIVQVFFASATIYKTRGDQVERYGYAAFGLTVLPYIIMSIVNLIGNLFTPDFPTMYLVRSPEMAEAEQLARGGWFDGVIGIVNDTPNDRGISVKFDEVADGFLMYVVDTTATVDGPVEDVVDNENGIVPTSDAISPVKQDPEAGPEKLEHVNIVHSMLGDTFKDFTALVQHIYTSLGFVKLPKLSAEDQRNLISESVFRISKDQTRSSKNLLVNFANQRVENLARVLPSRAGIAEMPVQPDLHLRVPAASNFQYDGSQAWSAIRVMIWTYFAFIMAGIPLAVVGALTHFKPGESTTPQRVWIMGWLVVGTFLGSVLPFCMSSLIDNFGVEDEDDSDSKESSGKSTVFLKWFFKIEFLLIYAAFAIGGFVVVGQMLKGYGSCSKLT